MRTKGVNKAWLGLTKPEDHCEEDDGECRWNGWSWMDGTEYQYPTWYKWKVSYEPGGNLCASFHPDGWWGTRCDYGIHGLLCEKGVLNVLLPSTKKCSYPKVS